MMESTAHTSATGMRYPPDMNDKTQSARSISACDPVNEARAKQAEAAIARAAAQVQADASKKHFHPLEVFPFFRRWPRSFLRNLIYTLLFNAMFAVLFTFLGYFGVLTSGRPIDLSRLVDQFGWNLMISNVIGFMFWGVLEALDPLMRYLNNRGLFVVVLSYTVLGTGIVTASFFILSLFPGFSMIGNWLFSPRQLMTSFLISLVVSSVLGLVWRRRVTELAGEIAFAEERARTESAERAATEANLRALQAQIEPHFLFNTLANVTSMIHTRPDEAKKMLEEFIAYLRATLAQTRENETTLGREFDLMEKFLGILKVRMGSRLSVNVALPDDLKQFPMPPMLVQPMVENAIKHGLEPKIEGGTLTLSAERRGDHVAIIIADTGLGFQDSGSNGIGLKNVRERMQKLYGERGVFSIEDNAPCGTRIVMSVPV
jgi:signal transduction histidine kinase